MNQIFSFDRISPVLFFYRILTLLLCLLLVNAGSAEAKVSKKVAFKWRANPSKEYVIGYRLYYGNESRFHPNGSPKKNFSYDYFIDFAAEKRCVQGSGGVSCEFLTEKELNCNNLYGNSPKCTVSKLRGHLYFALTAYNAQAESGFTRELDLTVNLHELIAAQQGITKLLLKEN